MLTTPKSMRLQIVLAGRSNSGKSSLLNLLCGSKTAITSNIPGTTTDVVEKAMEFRPFGPVLFLDTAGFDDHTELGEKRIEKTRNALKRADILLIVSRAGVWGDIENELLETAKANKVPAVAVFTHIDVNAPEENFLNEVKAKLPVLCCCALEETGKRDELLNELREIFTPLLKEKLNSEIPLLRDLLNPGDTVLMLVPIDNQAPKGRLILPQVQAIRDVLDADASVVVANENNFAAQLANLMTPPALVVCDSQVVHVMMEHLPSDIPGTTFSILFARLKGDLQLLYEGAKAIETLEDGDHVLIAEACTHHAADDDIGRVKIPKLISKKSGKKLNFEVISRDFPDDLTKYKLIIHCGSCMLNRQETLARLEFARSNNIPVTNFGMAISFCQGVLTRAMSPFIKNA